MPRINPEWKKARAEEIKQGKFISVLINYNPAAQWLITFLSLKEIPCKVTHLGAGVKRITIAKNVCPTCKGKGYVHQE
uniref:Uncharacterized protein n=1 Tax=viral metagenome TaxID=1070528 RepID=A0A6M3XCK2_9ZZZZ